MMKGQDKSKRDGSTTPTAAATTTTTTIPPKNTTKQTKMPTPQEMQELYDKITPLQKIVTLQHIYSLYMAAAQQSEKKEVSFNIIQLQRMINSNPLVNPDFDFLDISGFLNTGKEKSGKGGSINYNKGPVSPVQLIQILTESLTLRDERGRNEQVIQQVPNTMLFRLNKFIDLNFVKDRLIKLLNAYKNTTLKEIEELENKWKTKKGEIQKIEEGKMDDGVLYEEFLRDLKRKRGSGSSEKKVPTPVNDAKRENSSKSNSPAPTSDKNAVNDNSLKAEPSNNATSGGDISQAKKLQISRHVNKQIEKNLELAEKCSSAGVAVANAVATVTATNVEASNKGNTPEPESNIRSNVKENHSVKELETSQDTVKSPVVTSSEKEESESKEKDSVEVKVDDKEKEEEKDIFVDASENVSPKDKQSEIDTSVHNTRLPKHKLDDDDEEEEEEEEEEHVAKKPKVEEEEQIQTRARTRSISTSEEKTAHVTKVISKKFQQLSIQLIKNISSHRIASMFLNPVNAHDEPQYYELIKKPIDLKTITKRIKSRDIDTIEKLELEMQIMFTNAIMYNDMSQEDVYLGILDMKKEWEGLVSMLRENM